MEIRKPDRVTRTFTQSLVGGPERVFPLHTSLGPKGDTFVAGFTEDFYLQFMKDWAARMNHFLQTGETLKA